tara:strand:- start:528 stop:773 length:246 start_codon:yes stop_codon:yes gene_type:complete
MYDFYFNIINKNYKRSYLIDKKYINKIKIIKNLDYYYLDYKTSLNNLNNINIENEYKNEINQLINFMIFCKNNNLVVEVGL